MLAVRPRNIIDANGVPDVHSAREGGWARVFGQVPLSYSHVGILVAAVDAVLIIALGALSSTAYHLVAFEEVAHLISFSVVAFASALLFCLLLQSQHLYRTAAVFNTAGCTRTILVSWALTFCILLVFGFLGKLSWHVSRGATVTFFLAGATVLPLSRLAAKRVLKFMIANNYLAGRRRVVLFGSEQQLSSRNIAMNLGRHGYTIVEEIGLRSAAGSWQSGVALAEAVSKLKVFTRLNHVDEIFLAFNSAEEGTINLVADKLRSLPTPVRLLLDQRLGALLSRPMSDLGAAKAIKLQSGPLSEGQQLLKRMLDLTVASVAIFFLAPVFLIISAAIRADTPGPVLFRQRRAGFNGRIFRIYKFRSMTSLDDGDVIKQATRNDQRVTRVGRFLRKTSLDELPQLLNVLQGNMSLVGPRPHALSHDTEYDTLIATYALRHHMKPGITGWAQVNGCRGETRDLAMMEARVTHDLWYIRNWSLILDLRALLMTALQVIRPKNVY